MRTKHGYDFEILLDSSADRDGMAIAAEFSLNEDHLVLKPEPINYAATVETVIRDHATHAVRQMLSSLGRSASFLLNPPEEAEGNEWTLSFTARLSDEMDDDVLDVRFQFSAILEALHPDESYSPEDYKMLAQQLRALAQEVERKAATRARAKSGDPG